MKEEFWGNGYMTEAMKAIIAFAEDKMMIKEIRACIYVNNTNSIELAKRVGFVLSGSSTELFRGKEYPHHIYSYYPTQKHKSHSVGCTPSPYF